MPRAVVRGVACCYCCLGLELRAGSGGDGIVVSRACAATAVPVTSTTWAREIKWILAPSGSTLSLASSSIVLSSSSSSTA
jgi:hypothetical protein